MGEQGEGGGAVSGVFGYMTAKNDMEMFLILVC